MIATGGRQVAGLASGEAHESWPCEIPLLNSGSRHGRIDGAVGHAWRDGRAADRAQQTALKRLDVGWIGADQVGNAARQKIAEHSKAGAQHGIRRKLPGDRRSRLQNRERSGGERLPRSV